MTGDLHKGMPVNDNDRIDALLKGWARDREIDIAPGAALAAADAALAELRAQPGVQRRWVPAAIFGGSVAAALAGVLVLTPGPAPVDTPLDDAAGLPQIAAVQPEDVQMAAIADDFPEFDGPTDDLLMTSHVFTTRPDEELIY